MIKLYHAPRTRSLRILWLLEELGLAYELERVEFIPPGKRFFVQRTPLGKLPAIEDGDVVLCESGAIVEYILERYGEGRLAPPVGSAERAAFLQWVHFSESTAFPPLGILVWLTRYRGDGEQHPELIDDTRSRAASCLDLVARELGDKAYLLGDEFSAADIMMGFTLEAARVLGVLDDGYASLNQYLGRLRERPAYRKAVSVG